MSGILSVGGAGNVGGGTFYGTTIDQSLRFNDGDSAYLSRTPASAGNRKTWTWSGWVKLGAIGVSRALFSARSGNQQTTLFLGNLLQFYSEDSGGTTRANIKTNAVYRDPSAWYHIVFALDAANTKIDIYVNGVLQTQNVTTSVQNVNHNINTTLQHAIGREVTQSSYFDGYMAEVNFIDGTALDATSFGETINGIWVPKAYSGSYGTNGFYLSFADSSAIGDDLSGNTNDFTATNLAASDVVLDSPTNNFATLNPIEKDIGVTFKQGNLEVTTGAGFDLIRSTFFVSSGKWYWEVRATDCGNGFIGVSTANDTGRGGQDSNQSAVLTTSNGNIRTNATSSSYGNSVSDGDIIGIALDMDNGKIYFAENNTYYNSGDPVNETNPAATGLTTEVSPSISLYDNEDYDINFGQDSTFAGKETAGGNADANGIGDFKYAPPSGGFLALCSANLPEPTISPNSAEQADDYFTTMLHTGTGSQQAVTGAGFAPDLRWTKSRGSAYSHILHDNVRGETAYLQSNSTNAENTLANMSLDSDGFTVHADDLGDPQVSWLWKAGGTAVSNTDGSITSQVSAAPDAGFSIVSYTGTGASDTYGHGLGVAPNMILTKDRTDPAAWAVYVSDIGTGKYLELDQTDATTTAAAIYPSVSSTTIGVGVQGDGSITNTSGDNYISYCFANVDGYLKCGSYVGNGSTDGSFVYTGFRPAWIMVKNANAVTKWNIWDVERDTYNVMDSVLQANVSNAESSDPAFQIDVLSNGFKPRTTFTDINASGQTIIYLAYAEHPFKYANAR